MVWKVEFYEDQRGLEPVSDFFDKLDEATLNKVFKVIDILVKNGPMTQMPYSKRINAKIFELRTSGKKPIRLLYGSSNNKYILLHVFVKKTNKLLEKDLLMAEKRLKLIDYLSHI